MPKGYLKKKCGQKMTKLIDEKNSLKITQLCYLVEKTHCGWCNIGVTQVRRGGELSQRAISV